ncbi:metallophosphoesterase family protein [Noviherbaspirillum suwonense]|uniref:Calcineurin-like phosphoesterase n=1 Tax=Noviherbaspirillum suwonense TaxID=1224511 RepID=A0ABY1Q4H1_9BURK|nr:metallophosphoesterase [Noviherbaspirillum suwonense]SMP59385.1 Calcineurin-like phosphoesterase [Noviherbaspirillum suwonense]
MLKPHHTGGPLKLWSHLLLGTIASIVAAVMIVHGIRNLVSIFIHAISGEINNGGPPIYILVLGLLSPVIIWYGSKIKTLLSFVIRYLETVALGLAAFFIGFFERNARFEGNVVYWIVRAVSFALIIWAGKLAYFSLKQEMNKDSLQWASSFFITLTIYLTFSLTRLVAGRSDDWKSLAERVQLRLFSQEKIELDGFTKIPLIHLSDLHVTCSNTAPLAENPRIGVPDATLSALAESISALNAMPVIVSGDATDTGDATEWERFKRYFGPFKDRMVVAPGNHDLNIVGYGKGSLLTVTDLLYYEGRINRLRAYLCAANDIMGNRVRTLRSDVKGRPKALCSLQVALDDIKDERGSRQFEELNALFPLVVRVPSPHAVLYAIVWNTTRTSSLPTLNSLGKIDSGQMERLSGIAELLQKETAEPLALIHVLHHKVGMPVELEYHFGTLTKWEHRVQFASMTMQNASSLLRTIESLGADTVILHGHHHTRFAAHVMTRSEPMIDVISAPSSTLHCEGHVQGESCVQTPGFDVVSVGVKHRNARVVCNPQWNASVSAPSHTVLTNLQRDEENV